MTEAFILATITSRADGSLRLCRSRSFRWRRAEPALPRSRASRAIPARAGPSQSARSRAASRAAVSGRARGIALVPVGRFQLARGLLNLLDLGQPVEQQ